MKLSCSYIEILAFLQMLKKIERDQSVATRKKIIASSQKTTMLTRLMLLFKQLWVT